MFARMADGNPVPVRVISGQATLLARTMHQISVDSVHDELVVPNPFAEAILFFRGGADGEEAPIRIIQGPKTKLRWTDNVSVDPVHNEIFTAQRLTNAIFVFRRDASGDVEPIRIIQGPKTQLSTPKRVVVDPINNLLVVGNTQDPKGLLIFGRTDEGDMAPRAIISGARMTGNLGVKWFTIYPEGKRIFGVVKGQDSFVGVWKYSDNGDVAPWVMLKGSRLISPAGIAFDPDTQEVFIEGGGRPGAVLVYHLPEFFR